MPGTLTGSPGAALPEIKSSSVLRQPLGADGVRPMLVSLTRLRGAGVPGSGRLIPAAGRPARLDQGAGGVHPERRPPPASVALQVVTAGER